MIDYIEKAKAFAMMAHKGQTDKAGEDYFTAHVAVVADGVEPDPLVKAAAYLHDTVEDTGTTIDTIRAEFPPEVAEAVSVLTREKDMTYAEYIWRVSIKCFGVMTAFRCSAYARMRTKNCISVTAQKCEAKNAGSCIRRRSSKSNKSSAKARPRPKYSGIAV